MTRITTTPKATSCPWTPPITGALEETFGSRAMNAAPTSTSPERAQPGDGRADQDVQRQEDRELVRLRVTVRGQDEQRAATPANPAETPNANVL